MRTENTIQAGERTHENKTQAGPITFEIRATSIRDALRDLASVDSANEMELHRIAERIDGLSRIKKFGHHVACGTQFNQPCNCNGHVFDD